ncbi:MAG: hypothetical protein R3C45_03870 [Phycisphaerales bacterium]
MNTSRQADASLAVCENELRRVAAEALNAGDYAAARTVLGLAEAVCRLRGDASIDGGALADCAREVPGHKADPGKPNPTAKATRKQSRSAKAGVYPRFIRRDDKLIKIGWSKRHKQAYEHKAPQSVVSAVAEHLRRHTRDGKLFTVDNLLPVPDPEQGGELPSYQIYLVLAWFRSVGFVSKHGRDGYMVSHAELSEKAMADHWNALLSEDI